MHLRLLALALVVVAALVVPTAAVTHGGGSDEVASAVELVPHSGPNGQYASIDDGELRVDFERLNDDAVTTAHDVFNVTSTANRTIEVWVTTDLNESATVYAGENPSATMRESDRRDLAPGETLEVGVRIDTNDETPESGTVTVGVRIPDEEEAGTAPDDEPGDGGAAGGGGAAPTPTPAPEPVPVGNTSDVQIGFAGDANASAVTVRRLDELPEDGPVADPKSVITPGDRLPWVGDDGLDMYDRRLVAQQNETVHLTAADSVVSDAGGISREPRPASILEITAPPALRDTDATLRIRVDRSKFPDTNASRATIGRHTEAGWELLPTRVVERTDETVLLETRTGGFSVFTVFAESQVAYEWTLPSGETREGDELSVRPTEAGPYNVTLTVTDARGRTATATQAILVNDPPRATVAESAAGGDASARTLRANVTNEYGNASVGWRLPDGATARGATVSGAFAAGRTVTVEVSDDLGGATTTEYVVGAAGARPAAGIQALPLELPVWVYALAAVLAVASVYAVIRSGLLIRLPAGVAAAIGGVSRLLVDDSPRITAVEAPRWNPAEERIEIDELAVTAPSGLLRSIELVVTTADGDPVLTRELEVDAPSYTASPEHVPVYGGLDLGAERYRLEVRAVDELEQYETVATSPAVARERDATPHSTLSD